MIGSSTKALTSLMMARQVDVGRFNWETPVTQLLPEFQLGDAEATRDMRIRDTMSASTVMSRRDLDYIFKFKDVTPEQRLQQMRTMVPTTKFGETFQYSNYLVAAGGYAAARAHRPDLSLQKAYEAAITELVLQPLEMNDTILLQEEALKGQCASPHALNMDDRVQRISLHLERSLESVAPAGAYWSTATDLAKYLLFELSEGRAEADRPLLPREVLLFRRKGIKIDDKTSYGLGLIVEHEHGIEVVSHGGNTLGFSADMYVLPQKNVGVAVLTNRYLANDFLAALRQRLFELFFDVEPTAETMVAAFASAREENTVKRPARVRTNAEAVSWIGSLVGLYSCEELGKCEISDRGGRYWAQFDSWGSNLGVRIDEDGGMFIVLTDPPWSGLRLQVAGNSQSLMLYDVQRIYTFVKTEKVPQATPHSQC